MLNIYTGQNWYRLLPAACQEDPTTTSKLHAEKRKVLSRLNIIFPLRPSEVQTSKIRLRSSHFNPLNVHGLECKPSLVCSCYSNLAWSTMIFGACCPSSRGRESTLHFIRGSLARLGTLTAASPSGSTKQTLWLNVSYPTDSYSNYVVSAVLGAGPLSGCFI